jgi:hypothetical protein
MPVVVEHVCSLAYALAVKDGKAQPFSGDFPVGDGEARLGGVKKDPYIHTAGFHPLLSRPVRREMRAGYELAGQSVFLPVEQIVPWQRRFLCQASGAGIVGPGRRRQGTLILPQIHGE